MKCIYTCPTCGEDVTRVEHGRLVPTPHDPLVCPNGHPFEEVNRREQRAWANFKARHPGLATPPPHR